VAIGSLVRFRQMVGRGSRVHPAKDSCLVLDHGGNVGHPPRGRHGFFEDDPHWSLDITTKDAGEQGIRPTIECPRCKAIYRGGKCSSCGYEPTPKERKGQGLEFDGRELKEVKPEPKKATKEKTAEELMISALYIAGKSNRTWRQCCGIFKGMNSKQGTNYRVPKSITIAGQRYDMVPFGSSDSSRRVSVLYPFTVNRGEHSGEYLQKHSATIGEPY
jgi:hypothetical protein